MTPDATQAHRGGSSPIPRATADHADLLPLQVELVIRASFSCNGRERITSIAASATPKIFKATPSADESRLAGFLDLPCAEQFPRSPARDRRTRCHARRNRRDRRPCTWLSSMLAVTRWRKRKSFISLPYRPLSWREIAVALTFEPLPSTVSAFGRRRARRRCNSRGVGGDVHGADCVASLMA